MLQSKAVQRRQCNQCYARGITFIETNATHGLHSAFDVSPRGPDAKAPVHTALINPRHTQLAPMQQPQRSEL